jgi:DNA-directed RNA polymerase subunit RPC12/RpoP
MTTTNSRPKRFCPRCDSGRILKSFSRGTIEQLLLRIADVQLYRCCDCDKRFFGHPSHRIPMNGGLTRGVSH